MRTEWKTTLAGMAATVFVGLPGWFPFFGIGEMDSRGAVFQAASALMPTILFIVGFAAGWWTRKASKFVGAGTRIKAMDFSLKRELSCLSDGSPVTTTLSSWDADRVKRLNALSAFLRKETSSDYETTWTMKHGWRIYFALRRSLLPPKDADDK